MIPKYKKERCQKLRKQGFSLGRIIKITKLSKTTVFDQIKDIKFSKIAKKNFEWHRKKAIAVANGKRKGYCCKGRIVLKPICWSSELIYVISHFLFDGSVRRNSCIFYNRSVSQISRMQKNIRNLFGLEGRMKIDQNKVVRISYFYVELGEYVLKKVQELLYYIRTASLEEKKVFLQAFFDDEGCVSCDGGHSGFRRRRIRGYQHSKKILELIRKLLKEFDIESKIDKKNTEICVSRKANLIKFQEEINFSSGIYINPDRKNSIWKKKLEKRKILKNAINSYLN